MRRAEDEVAGLVERRHGAVGQLGGVGSRDVARRLRIPGRRGWPGRRGGLGRCRRLRRCGCAGRRGGGLGEGRTGGHAYAHHDRQRARGRFHGHILRRLPSGHWIGETRCMAQPVRAPVQAPSIELGDFQLTVHRRQFPDAHDRWDGNWLHVTAQCAQAGAIVAAGGPIVEAADLQRFRDELAAVQASRSGQAELSGAEPNIRVRVATGGAPGPPAGPRRADAGYADSGPLVRVRDRSRRPGRDDRATRCRARAVPGARPGPQPRRSRSGRRLTPVLFESCVDSDDAARASTAGRGRPRRAVRAAGRRRHDARTPR